MIAYILRRLVLGVIVLAGLAVVVFFVSHVIGDIARIMLPVDATQEQYEQLRRELGLDQPLQVQFLHYIEQLARGDFGNSLWQGVPAMSLVLERFPATLYLTLSTILFSLVVAVPLGILSAFRPGSFADKVATLFSMIGMSIPTFWLALVLIIVLAVRLDWLETSGYGGPKYLIMPVISLAAPTIGRLVQVIRSSILDELRRPYLTTARGKGLPELVVIVRHAFRNALLPIVTLLADEMADLLTGAVVVEVIFAWPGMGNLALQAIERRDFPVIQSVVLFVAALIVLINLAVDIIYVYIDPRIRYR